MSSRLLPSENVYQKAVQPNYPNMQIQNISLNLLISQKTWISKPRPCKPPDLTFQEQEYLIEFFTWLKRV
ncbi:hypothetical protein FC85_GL000526 [Lentilactobacillus diolivorans DSM 14421]|uniref:Uncharacterized protein n=1 Tax=Lentilactobacillus diolivorans DSM 14421 TaxID=1423739 RepID=A0A0R1S807_9LACO|nr:hypothetical protein FC85_GL000526 [Lentilactobacillus diolivorans DSM 14421]